MPCLYFVVPTFLMSRPLPLNAAVPAWYAIIQTPSLNGCGTDAPPPSLQPAAHAPAAPSVAPSAPPNASGPRVNENTQLNQHAAGARAGQKGAGAAGRSSAPKTGSRLIGIADDREFPSLGGGPPKVGHSFYCPPRLPSLFESTCTSIEVNSNL